MPPKQVVSGRSDNPVLARGRDECSASQPVENFLTSPAFYGVGEPSEMTVGSDGGVFEDLALRFGEFELGRHGILLGKFALGVEQSEQLVTST